MVVTLVPEKEHSIVGDPVYGGLSGEVMAFCPECKAVQTLVINKGQLIQTRKYIQQENRVYHDCGSSRPCKLYCSL